MGILVAIIIVPIIVLAFYAIGAALLRKGIEDISSSVSEIKAAKSSKWANDFYSKYGVNASAALYMTKFIADHGRTPVWPSEVKIPAGRDASEFYNLVLAQQARQSSK